MTGHGQALSLGALFHHLRDGLADRGLARVSVDFRLESTVLRHGGAAAETPVRRGFRAALDYEDEVLRQAQLVSTAMSPRPLAELRVALHEGRYVYSRDGERYGLLIDTPRLYDVYSFESRLSRIDVVDVILEEDAQPDVPVVNILRVDITDESFQRLIGIFGDDLTAMNEALEAADRSLVMTAGDDVGVHYRWRSWAGRREGGDHPDRRGAGTRHSSRVSIRLEPLDRLSAQRVLMDRDLDELGSIDDLWTQERRAMASGPALMGRRL
ncbi:MAG: hypothetical protein ABR564_04350 [Candidatus Dormibacteria bacterium]